MIHSAVDNFVTWRARWWPTKLNYNRNIMVRFRVQSQSQAFNTLFISNTTGNYKQMNMHLDVLLRRGCQLCTTLMHSFIASCIHKGQNIIKIASAMILGQFSCDLALLIVFISVISLKFSRKTHKKYNKIWCGPNFKILIHQNDSNRIRNNLSKF